MKVFISWSGELSQAIADELRKWLPSVLQAVKPYFSPDDIAKGTRWESEVSKELESSSIGLFVVTPDNINAPWILFEAGAIAKNLGKAKVCPLLFGLEPTDFSGPLVQFQAARFDRREFKRVVSMINSELGEQALTSDVLDSVFEMWWPKLEQQINRHLKTLSSPSTKQGTRRSERDLLEEVLALVRSTSRESIGLRVTPLAIRDLETRYSQLLALTAANEEELPKEHLEAIYQLEKPVRYLVQRLSGPTERSVDAPPEVLRNLRNRWEREAMTKTARAAVVRDSNASEGKARDKE